MKRLAKYPWIKGSRSKHEAGMQPKEGGTINVGLDLAPNSLDVPKYYLSYFQTTLRGASLIYLDSLLYAKR